MMHFPSIEDREAAVTLFVKICGLSTEETVRAAKMAGADCIGLVFFPKSPRNVDFELAERLAATAREAPAILIAALVVDADPDLISTIANRIKPDLFQLHGRETPQQVARIKADTGLAVMKAIGVRNAEDLQAIEPYLDVVDRILLDAKPPKGGDLPGGNGVAFDWSLLESLDLDHRFMLSGGLVPQTVAAALQATGMSGVDVSSGVESAPGVKDARLIADFVEAARNHSMRQSVEG